MGYVGDMCVRELEIWNRAWGIDDIMISTEYPCDPFQKWQLLK
jgi:hypothetical protein